MANYAAAIFIASIIGFVLLLYFFAWWCLRIVERRNRLLIYSRFFSPSTSMEKTDTGIGGTLCSNYYGSLASTSVQPSTSQQYREAGEKREDLYCTKPKPEYNKTGRNSETTLKKKLTRQPAQKADQARNKESEISSDSEGTGVTFALSVQVHRELTPEPIPQEHREKKVREPGEYNSIKALKERMDGYYKRNEKFLNEIFVQDEEGSSVAKELTADQKKRWPYLLNRDKTEKSDKCCGVNEGEAGTEKLGTIMGAYQSPGPSTVETNEDEKKNVTKEPKVSKPTEEEEMK